MSSILHIADGSPAGFESFLEAFQAGEMRVLGSMESELENTLAQSDENFDAAVIARSVRTPISVARTVHASRPNAHIVFVTDSEREAALRKQLMFAPRIGAHWSVVREERADVAAEVIRSAIEGAARRRQLRTTLNRINASLAVPQLKPSKQRIVSDEFVASVFDQLSDAVVMVDAEGLILAANATASRTFAREIVRGMPLTDLLGNSSPDGEHTREMTVRRSDGGELTLEVTFEPVLDGERRRVGTAVVARDITQRRLAEQRRRLLSDATARLSDTLDMTQALQRFAEAVVTTLADLCVVDLVDGEQLSRTAVAAGDERDIPLVQDLKQYDPPPGRLAHPAVIAWRRNDVVVINHASGSQLESITTDPRHLELAERLGYHSIVSAPIPVGEQVAGAITFVRGRREDSFDDHDVELIRELARRAGTALHHAWLYHAADQANRAKDAFLATLSHELRTPMTSILGWIQILRMGPADETSIDEGLDVIEKSARLQAQLIEDLLDLSRITMGKLRLETSLVNLGEVARAALDTILPAARARELTLDSDIDDTVVVAGDANRLQQVVWNLLSNAVKFTPRGGTVDLTLDQTGSRARISVQDSGKGIEPGFLPKVFERFQQADSATTRKYGGLGLGLAIVRQLVELHGGAVEARSEGEGKGATFVVYLPIPAVKTDPRPPVSSEAETAKPEIPLKGLRILIVEDDPESAAMLRALLSRAGASVDTCDTVSGASEFLRTRRPDLLISDIAMPHEDGFDLIRHVRNTLHITPEQLPALALTAFGDMDTRVAALGAGFQRHLKKPAEIDDILALAMELTGRAPRDRSR